MYKGLKKIVSGLVIVANIGLVTPPKVHAVTIIPPEIPWMLRNAGKAVLNVGSTAKNAAAFALRNHAIQRLVIYGGLASLVGAGGYLAIDQAGTVKKAVGNKILLGYKQLNEFKDQLKNDKSALHAIYDDHEHFEGNSKYERLDSVNETLHAKLLSGVWSKKVEAYNSNAQKTGKPTLTGQFFPDLITIIEGEIADLKSMEKAVVDIHRTWDKAGLFLLDDYLSTYIKEACKQGRIRGPFEIEKLTVTQYENLDKAVKSAISGWRYYPLSQSPYISGRIVENIKAIYGTAKNINGALSQWYWPLWWNFKGEMEFLWMLKKKTYKLQAMIRAIARWQRGMINQSLANTRTHQYRRLENKKHQPQLVEFVD